jgi:hypothetical protein
VLQVFLAILTWVYLGWCLYRIAQKSYTPHEWLAFVPVANILLMCRIGRAPDWLTGLSASPLLFALILAIGSPNIIYWTIMTTLLSLTSLVSAGTLCYLWASISSVRKKQEWVGLVSILPFLNLIIPGYLAWD